MVAEAWWRERLGGDKGLRWHSMDSDRVLLETDTGWRKGWVEAETGWRQRLVGGKGWVEIEAGKAVRVVVSALNLADTSQDKVEGGEDSDVVHYAIFLQ